LPAVDAGLAQDARAAAAQRLARRERPADFARPIAPTAEAEPDTNEPAPLERLRLHFLDGYYRGTLLGAGRLASLAHLAATPEEPGTNPERKRVNDDLRREYRQIVADLARYDRMHSASGLSELGAAALGQFGGGLLSPEGLVGTGAKGVNLLGRIVNAGLRQGAVSAAVDPVVQGLNINAGVQDSYDPVRTAGAFGAAAVSGGATKAAAEAISHAGAFWRPAKREQARAVLYDKVVARLQQLDSANPELRREALFSWTPGTGDIYPLNRETAAEKARLKGVSPSVAQLERHHNIPRAKRFKAKFDAVGIDPEDYVLYMPKDEHRLKPNGLHANADHWNGQWDEFFAGNPNPSPEEVFGQLYKMFKYRGW
jgi:hypothetical protein